MEIGEQQLAFFDQGVFWGDRLFYLDDHVGGLVNILNGRQYDGPYIRIARIGESTAFAGGMLYKNLMSVPDQLTYSCRSHADTVLSLFDFFWNSDFHSLSFRLVKMFDAVKI